jgi:hypothetical protein
MPRMILRAVHAHDERRRWPLSERIVDENLGRYRHVPQSSQRPRSATADTEALETRSAELDEPQHRARGRGLANY